MTEEIKKELLRLERQHEIKILLAVESGSRAWGFASTDSDWDVRYIYIHKLDWYLKIDQQRDTQEEILPNDIDLAGWELKKALRLFRKSNPALLEWLQSPLVYLEQGATAEKLRCLTNIYFDPKACLYHYLSMADGNYRNYLQNELVRVKKYFYVLRPILSCAWIEQKSSMPPLEFQNLVRELVSQGTLRDEIDQLLIKKKSGIELDLEPKNKVLDAFIEEKLQYYKAYVTTLPSKELPDTSLLDDVFKQSLCAIWK